MTMLVYMVGRNIPLYGIDIDAYSNVNVDAQSILLQAISGDMKNCSIFIIGLWPYMLASMLAILIVAIMSLDHTRKLSPKKINIWTVTIMMIIAAVQAYHKTQTLMYRVSGDELIWNKIIVFIQLIAGMLIVVYMCDRATKYGIGGKVSVFMVNMVSGMMTMFTGKPLEKLALPVAIGVAEIAVMIVLETTEKRIAVQRVSINNITRIRTISLTSSILSVLHRLCLRQPLFCFHSLCAMDFIICFRTMLIFSGGWTI